MEQLNKLIIVGLYIVFLFPTQSCTSTRKINELKDYPDWKLVKVDKSVTPSWTIYSRRLDGTNFLEYSIVGVVHSSPKVCASVFKQDIVNLSKGTKKDKDYDFTTYDIVDESNSSLLTYVIHNEPFPFKDTEMSIRYHFFEDSENGMEEVKWKEAWEECAIPPSKKLSRVETFRGSWQFVSITNDTSQAVNRVQFDAKKMPHWLVNKMVKKFLVGGLEKIRELVSK